MQTMILLSSLEKMTLNSTPPCSFSTLHELFLPFPNVTIVYVPFPEMLSVPEEMVVVVVVGGGQVSIVTRCLQKL